MRGQEQSTAGAPAIVQMSLTIRRCYVKQFTLLCAIIACLAVSAHAATLTYNDEIFATEGAQQVRYMDITATEGSEEIWKMRINLGDRKSVV